MTNRTEAPVDETTEEDPESRPEGFQLRQTGRVAIWWDDRAFDTLIGRPKIGQFRRLRESFGFVTVEGQKMRDRLRDLQERLKTADPDEYGEIQAAINDIDEARGQSVIGWIFQVNKELGSMPMPTTENGDPDYDRMPPWLGNSQIAQSILAHWRAVPLAPGGKAK